MPRLGLKPTPKKRYHGGRWRIYWKWNGKQYSIPTNYLDQKKTALVDSDLRLISAALAMAEPDFPELYVESSAVLQYMLDRYGRNDQSDIPTDPDWIAAYQSTLFSEASKGWATHSMRYLNELNEFCNNNKDHNRHDGDIRMTTSAQAQEYLNSIILSGKSAGTRNRVLSACNSFFKWAIRTHRTRRNPFAGIKILPEQDAEDIVYCTKAERREIIEIVKASGWPDGHAIPIAFYAGMRREEVCRLKWNDVFFDQGQSGCPKRKDWKTNSPIGQRTHPPPIKNSRVRAAWIRRENARRHRQSE